MPKTTVFIGGQAESLEQKVEIVRSNLISWCAGLSGLLRRQHRIEGGSETAGAGNGTTQSVRVYFQQVPIVLELIKLLWDQKADGAAAGRVDEGVSRVVVANKKKKKKKTKRNQRIPALDLTAQIAGDSKLKIKFRVLRGLIY